MPGETGHTLTNRSSNSPGPARSQSITPGQFPLTPAPEPSYYDISFLKKPVWKWEIAGYFFLGGISAGAYVLARTAEHFGGDEYRDITRKGTHIALFTALPCAPLLIKDLGDAKRFHHMLRIFKPTSPMSLGSWTMTSFVGMVMLNSLREWARDHGLARKTFAGRFLDDTLVHATDLLGIPLAIMLAGYTGVLLSCTANPLWVQNPWIGPLFSASAVSTGASAVNLMMTLGGGNPENTAARAVEKIDSVAHIIEAATLAGYLRHAGAQARPLTQGSMKRHMFLAGCAIVASEAIKRLPVSPRAKRATSITAALSGLAAGFYLRWAFIYGGHEAAADPKAARQSSRPRLAGKRTHKFPHPAKRADAMK